jgi:hypothetical protein
MGMLMKAANEEGQELTLDEAYATAIQMDPELRKLEAQRVRADHVRRNKVNIEKARRAASSPRPSPRSAGSGSSSGDRHHDVEAAWDEVESRSG